MFLAKWTMSFEEYLYATKGTPEGEHKLVWSLYKDHNGKRYWQYRIENLGNIVIILIESSIKFEKETNIGTFIFKEIEIPDSKYYHVKVTLNPIIQKKELGRKNSKRIPLIKDYDIKNFIKNKFLFHGLEIKSFVATKPIKTVSMQDIIFTKIEVSGVVKVINKEKVLNAIKNGIGKEKSYGCGMLCLIPVNECDFEI